MRSAGINRLIFSSSETVYGKPESVPLNEQSRIGSTTTPCGASKFMVEQILADFWRAQPEFRITCLRYFNPAGAHPSGRIGEVPKEYPVIWSPIFSRWRLVNWKQCRYLVMIIQSPDGTGVRDYIHVMDLATGHIAALDCLDKGAAFKTIKIASA